MPHPAHCFSAANQEYDSLVRELSGFAMAKSAKSKAFPILVLIVASALTWTAAWAIHGF
jgi:hypothetical protein